VSRRLGWGIVGLGNIARGTIAPILATEPDCAIAAVTSRDQGRADAFAAEFSAQGAYTDYAEMLGDPSVEAVFIATPNALHAEQVVAAARAGKHVLCDKPLAIDVADAARAVEACDAAGVLLGVNFHNRFLPWVRDVSRIVADGAIGDVLTVHVEVGGGAKRYDNWRADPRMAGLGTVHNVGVHALDFLRMLLDSEPVEVSAMFDEAPGGGAVEMLALIVLRFANGALVYCNANERHPYARNDITIHGTAGRITGTGVTRSRSSGDLTVLTDRGETVTRYPATEAHRSSVAAFTASVMRGRSPAPSGVDGLRSAELCEAVRRSAVERRTVEIRHTSHGHAARIGEVR
jgi:1,5-anhydro-D-fructose reductase (1,5-anhydro-D-mannitol-forming)